MAAHVEPNRLALFLNGGWLFRNARELVMVVAITGLILTNLASVTSTLVHDAIYGVVSSIANIAGPEAAKRILGSSPTVRQGQTIEAKTKDLQRSREAQLAQLKKLDAEHRQLQAAHTELGRRHQQAIEARRAQTGRVKQMASSIKTRIARNVVRNTEALPAKVLPAVGISVTVGLTAWDLYDACQTMKDVNKVLLEDGQPAEDSSAICGMATPSSSQVLASLRSGWRASVNKTRTEFASMQGKLQLPEIRMPTGEEVRQVVCPVAALPGMCP